MNLGADTMRVCAPCTTTRGCAYKIFLANTSIKGHFRSSSPQITSSLVHYKALVDALPPHCSLVGCRRSRRTATQISPDSFQPAGSRPQQFI